MHTLADKLYETTLFHLYFADPLINSVLSLRRMTTLKRYETRIFKPVSGSSSTPKCTQFFPQFLAHSAFSPAALTTSGLSSRVARTQIIRDFRRRCEAKCAYILYVAAATAVASQKALILSTKKGSRISKKNIFLLNSALRRRRKPGRALGEWVMAGEQGVGHRLKNFRHIHRHTAATTAQKTPHS